MTDRQFINEVDKLISSYQRASLDGERSLDKMAMGCMEKLTDLHNKYLISRGRYDTFTT